MKIKIIAVGSRAPDPLQILIDNYLKRLPHTFQISIDTIAIVKQKSNVKEIEAKKILAKVSSSALIVALDEHGSLKTTLKFAQLFQSWLQHHSEIYFIIGGPEGLA